VITICQHLSSDFSSKKSIVFTMLVEDKSLNQMLMAVMPLLCFQGEPGFLLAQQLIGRALHIPGATVHWYDKPG